MSEKGFGDSQARPGDLARSETPFHEQLHEAGDSQLRNGLQALSPDKRVYDVGTLGPQERAIVQNLMSTAADQWSKVSGPLRNVYSNAQRQLLNGNDNQAVEKWTANYMAKVGEVLRDNISHLSDEVPFRVAFPVQSFLPGQDGQIKAEVLHAFFPPLQTDIQERYVTMPLHSPDPGREAQLRRNPSLANHITSDELVFRGKVAGVMPRRDRMVEQV